MNYDFRAHPFQAASVALIVALAGCAPGGTSSTTISDDTRARLAQALQDSGDSANAAVLRDQTSRKPAPVADPLTHATALIAAGQVDQGISDAKAALAARGDDLAFALEVGRLAVRSGRLTDAADVYRQISLRHPDSAEALNGKGVVLAQQGDLNGAGDAFRKALALRPQDVPARNNLALVMLLSGETDAAMTILEDLSHSDGSPQVRATLALARARSQVKGSSQPIALAEVPAKPLVAPPAPPPQVKTQAAPPPVRTSVASPPPASGPDDRRIVVRARADAWVQVRDASGQVLLDRELHSGESWSVPNKPGLVLATGNAGDTDLLVDGVVAASLGGRGMIRRDVPLDPDMIKAGKLVTQIRTAQASARPVSDPSVSQ
jgi:cytoskeleton protein RodZ